MNSDAYRNNRYSGCRHDPEPCDTPTPCPRGATGPRGPMGCRGPIGPTGEKGATGEKGPTGPCCHRQELLFNNGFDSFKGVVPAGWQVNQSTRVSPVTCPGHVYTGTSAVALSNGAVLSQTIALTAKGTTHYLLTFFARSVSETAALTVDLTYTAGESKDKAGTLTVPAGSLFGGGYHCYHLLSDFVPENATELTVDFIVNGDAGDTVELDNVSLLSL